MAFPKFLKSLRLFRLIPAALISVIVMALMSLLGLLNFGSGVPSEPASPPAQTAEANEPTGEALLGGPEVLGGAERPADRGRGQSSGPPQAPTSGESVANLNPSRLLDVLIDGETFLVRVDAGQTRQPRRLDEIESLAGDVPGDDSGIRARVTRRFNAVARAERALLETLSNAGLTDDEIDYRRTLVD